MKLEEQWADVLTLFFLVLGFVISVLLKSAVWSYLSMIIAGGLAGRVYYIKHAREPIFPFVLMMIGFLLGYLVGNFWTSRLLTLLFFGLSFGASYYLHVKKILVIFKSKQFLK
jgi:xanthosine utilization system XapX-like protein